MAVTNKGQYISPEEEMAKMDTDITDEEMASR